MWQEKAPALDVAITPTLPSRKHVLNRLLHRLPEIEGSRGALSRAALQII